MDLSDRTEGVGDIGGSAVTLGNGVRTPILGLRVYRCPPGQETDRAVTLALQTGY